MKRRQWDLSSGVSATHDLIEEISEKNAVLRAFQSKQKILALNVSTEAARAGEVGAGFSVVAEEVEKLLAQSSRVYAEVKDLVQKISATVETMRE